MTQVIIVVRATSISVSYSPPADGDKLIFTGAGIEFHLHKECRSLAGRWDAIRHQVMIVAQAHHIPQISLRDHTASSYARRDSKANREAKKNTKRLI